MGANENEKERLLTARRELSRSVRASAPSVCAQLEAGDTRFRSLFIVLPLFYSHGIYPKQPSLFDRYLFALQFSSDRGISPRILPYFVCELFLIYKTEKKNVHTAINLSRVLIYRGVVQSTARFKAISRRSSEQTERCSLLEPRTDRPGKDSSFLRTMVLDKEEGE